MRLAFMGTPDFSVPTLAELLGQSHEIAAVYTQPARPAGRGQQLQASPVEQFAHTHGLEVRTPLSLKSAEEQARFAGLDLDAAIVVAFGLILPRAILAAPRLGCFNVHASLLPRWRGAAPIQRAIMAGDRETGVAIMQMEAGLDTGPVLMSERIPIGPDATAGSLHDELSKLGASLMIRALAAIERGSIKPVPQSESGVTYAEKIDKSEARLDWRKPAAELDQLIRAMSPSPGAWFECPDREGRPMRVRVLSALPVAGKGAPGEVLGSEGLRVACAVGALEFARLQRAGGNALSAEEFRRGFPVLPGARLS